MTNQETYQIDAICKNCGFDGKVDIPKKTAVNNFECPTCGMKEIVRDLNAHLKNRKPISYR